MAAHPRVWNKRDLEIPPNAIYVGRGSPWGNPYRIGVDGDRAAVIEKFRHKVWRMPEQQRSHWLRALRGHDLVCWCAPLSCHADLLLLLANARCRADVARALARPA